MRRLFLLFLPLAVLAVLAGCPRPAPDLGPPPRDCATRAAASLALVPNEVDGGPGPEDAGLLISQGIQGGSHILINLESHHLGPLVLVEPTVTDAKTGEILSQSGLAVLQALGDGDPATPEPDGGWPVYQVEGRLAADPATVVGRTVILAAEVSDACPHRAGASRTGVVTGYDTGF